MVGAVGSVEGLAPILLALNFLACSDVSRFGSRKKDNK